MGNKERKKLPTCLCDRSKIVTLNSFFRQDKESRRFGSCDDSLVAYISTFKNSPSILNELVDIYLLYPSPICLRGVNVKALPSTFLPSRRSLVATLQDSIRK